MSKNNLYRIRVYPVETDANTIEWAAEIPDLPGCIGAGDTAEEAVSMALDAKKAWIDAATEEGREVPKPKNLYQDDFSGKFTLRLPKTLHKELTIQAEEEGVSINQYVLFLISKSLDKNDIMMRYKMKNEITSFNWYNFLPNLSWKAEDYSTEQHYENILT